MLNIDWTPLMSYATQKICLELATIRQSAVTRCKRARSRCILICIGPVLWVVGSD